MLSSTVLQATVRVDTTGTSVEIPVIMTAEGVLRSYLEYLIVFRLRSESWKRRSVFAVRLLLDYMSANHGVFDKPRDMFREFSNSLFTGTLDEHGNDSSGLRWTPRRHADATFIINLITHFTDYLSEVNEDKNFQLNPLRDASPFEQKLKWAAYYQKKERAFLSHLWKQSDALETVKKMRAVSKPNKPLSNNFDDTVVAFPDARITELIYHGFVLPGKDNKDKLHERLNLRDVLITMLMHYGGLRISEVCHLYTQDIAELTGSSLKEVVKVYHPSEGMAPTGERITRREFLLRKFRLKPRNELSGSRKQYAGWKDPLLTNSKEQFFTVEWFPGSARESFYFLWKLYIKYQRVEPTKDALHPYAFTSKTGAPFTIKGYHQSAKRAVERIGLKYSKYSGTTPHAHRHSYGQNLAKSGVPPIVIRAAMHHKSMESQLVYTRPTEKEVRLQLARAELNMLSSSEKLKSFLNRDVE